jgi:hypothetical protein
VSQSSLDAGFREKSMPNVLAASELIVEHLDGMVAVEDTVLGSVDHRHSAGAKL